MPSSFPNVNASLLREFRMVAQQFFRHKENLSFFDAPKRPQAVPLRCCFCVNIKKRPFDADTIIEGFAVCAKHARYVREDSSRYVKIHEAVMRDEGRR